LCALDAAILIGVDEPDVRAMADAARTTFVELGSSPFMARLEAAMGAVPGVDPATSPAGGAAVGEPASAAI
jgi:hypothetical protein